MGKSRKRARAPAGDDLPNNPSANPQLVNDVFQIIAHHAPFRLFASAARVSKRFNALFTSPLYWKKIIRHHFPHFNIEDNEVTDTRDWSQIFKRFEKAAFTFYSLKSSYWNELKLAFFYAKEGDLRNFKKVFISEMRYAIDHWGFNLTNWAARYNHQSILNYIYEASRPDMRFASNQLLLAIACRKSMRQIKSYFSDRHIHLENHHLIFKLARQAAMHGYQPCLQFIVENYIKIINWEERDCIDLLELTCKYAYIDCVQYLLTFNPPKARHSLLYDAAEAGNAHILRLLINYGIDAKQSGLALTLAAEKGNLECVRILLDCGVKLDQPYEDADHYYTFGNKDEAFTIGQAALAFALTEKHHKIATLLCQYKINVNFAIVNNGWQYTLSIATTNKNPNMIKTLLESGAKIETDDHMTCPIQIALTHPTTDCLAALLSQPVYWSAIRTPYSAIINNLVHPAFYEHLQLLLNSGYPINNALTCAHSLLFKAILVGNSQAVALLMKHHADAHIDIEANKKTLGKSIKVRYGYNKMLAFNKYCKSIDAGDIFKITPFTVANLIGNADILNALTISEMNEIIRLRQ